MKTTFEPSQPISLYLDEDVAETIAVALRLRGYDVVTVKESSRKGYSDLEQLQYAVACGRTMFTHNIADFCRLHAEFMRRGEAHAGIVVSKQLYEKFSGIFKKNVPDTLKAPDTLLFQRQPHYQISQWTLSGFHLSFGWSFLVG